MTRRDPAVDHAGLGAVTDAHQQVVAAVTAAHHTGMAALLAEVRLARLVEAMRPYLPSSPLPPPRPPVRIPTQRSRQVGAAERYARALGARPSKGR